MGIFRKGFKAMFERNKWKILRGDNVMITAGKDRGQSGTVLKVIRDEKFPRVLVEGLNLVRDCPVRAAMPCPLPTCSLPAAAAAPAPCRASDTSSAPRTTREASSAWSRPCTIPTSV